MEYREKRKKVIFTYRYEKKLHGAIRKELAKRKKAGKKCSEQSLILEAFKAFAEAYNRGNIDFKKASDFKGRLNKKNKITRQMIFPRKPKLILARMAFTFILSQAEVLRMALEWYIRGKCRGEKNYYLKNNHDSAIPFIATIRYNLFDLDILGTFSTTPLNGLFPP